MIGRPRISPQSGIYKCSLNVMITQPVDGGYVVNSVWHVEMLPVEYGNVAKAAGQVACRQGTTESV